MVPLGEGKTARCAFCHAETPIPDEYGSLQRATQAFASDRTLAEKLYGRLGRPPGRFARAIGRGAEGTTTVGANVGMILFALAVDQPFIGVAMMMALAYAIGWPVAGIVRGGNFVLGRPPLEPLSPYPILFAATLIALLLIGIPIIILGRERKLSDVRQSVHASLAAALPEREGGPCRCRNCGAALDVPNGALGVPCAYCKADNLVALPADWVALVRGRELQHFLQIDSALEAYRQASDAARDQMWKLGFAIVMVLPLVMVLAWFLTITKIYF
jgi:hypothetical protein